jgi:tRNA threonylcarbamoyladenosine biosynthesis protein TsaB
VLGPAGEDTCRYVFLSVMILLATDTTGKHGSIAIARVEPDGGCDVIEVAPLAGGTFSAQLIPQIAGLLAKRAYTRSDIAGFAVASGPGSFTGLRVGLAAIKALADVLQKPIAAVSLLEALALSAGVQGDVTAALDAGRGEVYAADYRVNASGAHLLAQRLHRLDELGGTPLLLTPDANVLDAGRIRGMRVLEVARPRSDVIARLGWKKILANQTTSPEDLDANYIRRSDAEIFSKSS